MKKEHYKLAGSFEWKVNMLTTASAIAPGGKWGVIALLIYLTLKLGWSGGVLAWLVLVTVWILFLIPIKQSIDKTGLTFLFGKFNLSWDRVFSYKIKGRALHIFDKNGKTLAIACIDKEQHALNYIPKRIRLQTE